MKPVKSVTTNDVESAWCNTRVARKQHTIENVIHILSRFSSRFVYGGKTKALSKWFFGIIALSLSAHSYGENFEDVNFKSGSEGDLSWSVADGRYIDGVGVHQVNTFKNTTGNSTPYDAYARSELDVTGAGGCTAEQISSSTGCNRSGAARRCPPAVRSANNDTFSWFYPPVK